MATYASAHHPFGSELPRPLRSAMPFVVLGLAALALAIAPDLPWTAGAATGVLFIVAAAVQFGRAEHELRLLRRQADRTLLRGVAPSRRSALVEWRAAELTTDEHRLRVADGANRVLRELDLSRLPGASPLNRVAVRPHEDLIVRLRARLGDVGAPVEARGVLMAEWLLGDVTSPFYDRRRADAIPRALTRVLAALEPPA